jgi:hypothetical protein
MRVAIALTVISVPAGSAQPARRRRTASPGQSGSRRGDCNSTRYAQTPRFCWQRGKFELNIAPGTRTDKFRVGTTTLLSDEKGESRISAEDHADALVTELEKRCTCAPR